MKKMRVMFVDDETMILSGLKRALYGSGWDILLATSGQQALTMLADNPVDFVMSDMQMVGMSGAEFLEKVTELHPESVRIVLSGHADQKMAVKSSFVAHQWFSKPCNPDIIRERITRIAEVRDTLPDAQIRAAVGGIKALPAPPKLYLTLKDMVEHGADMASIGRLISQDAAISSKVLQLANSAFFSASSISVSRVDEAITRLGLDIVASIVVVAEVYAKVPPLPGYDFHQHQIDSLATALFAASLVDKGDKDATMLAGLLHNLGDYLLACLLQQHAQLHGQEPVQLACYLLHLWNFPYSLIDILMLHNHPQLLQQKMFGPAHALYIASTLMQDQPLHAGLVEQFGWQGLIPEWQALAQKFRQRASAA